ncbi:MAG: hypothetical protein V7K57_17335 [Nostoc sp.]|uniref:hypothetical protein n=1 Tax=Nostoc sp. TaxID=1180 RepID=UPI002FF7827A
MIYATASLRRSQSYHLRLNTNQLRSHCASCISPDEIAYTNINSEDWQYSKL